MLPDTSSAPLVIGCTSNRKKQAQFFHALNHAAASFAACATSSSTATVVDHNDRLRKQPSLKRSVVLVSLDPAKRTELFAAMPRLHAVLHKRTDDMAVAATDARPAVARRAARRVANLRKALSSDDPAAPVAVDPIDGVWRLIDRKSISQAVQAAVEPLSTVQNLRWATLVPGQPLDQVQQSLQHMQFPVILKRRLACGTKASHEMVIAYSLDAVVSALQNVFILPRSNGHIPNSNRPAKLAINDGRRRHYCEYRPEQIQVMSNSQQACNSTTSHGNISLSKCKCFTSGTVQPHCASDIHRENDSPSHKDGHMLLHTWKLRNQANGIDDRGDNYNLPDSFDVGQQNTKKGVDDNNGHSEDDYLGEDSEHDDEHDENNDDSEYDDSDTDQSEVHYETISKVDNGHLEANSDCRSFIVDRNGLTANQTNSQQLVNGTENTESSAEPFLCANTAGSADHQKPAAVPASCYSLRHGCRLHEDVYASASSISRDKGSPTNCNSCADSQLSAIAHKTNRLPQKNAQVPCDTTASDTQDHFASSSNGCFISTPTNSATTSPHYNHFARQCMAGECKTNERCKTFEQVLTVDNDMLEDCASTNHSPRSTLRSASRETRNGRIKSASACLRSRYLPHDYRFDANHVIAQEFVPCHGSLVYKIYAIGDRVEVKPRTSVTATYDTLTSVTSVSSEKARPYYRFDSQGINKREFPAQSNADVPPPSQQVASDIVQALSRELGLTLLGIDVVYNVSQGKYAVVDVNYFPGYKGVEDVHQAILDHVMQLAEHALRLSCAK